MAGVYLSTFEGFEGEFLNYPKKRLRESAACDAHKKHFLVDCPKEADIIIFATNADPSPVGLGIMFQQLYRKYPAKCILLDSGDSPSPLVGGLCASWPLLKLKDAAPSFGWCYFHPTSAEPYINASYPVMTAKYLWSFVGSSCTHPIRKNLFYLADSEAYIRDTSSQTLPNLMSLTSNDLREKFRKEYIDILFASRFIVCPRGIGASSMRIFEAMRAGRVPVIISDQWASPQFVDWDKSSLRIKESDVNKLPSILRDFESMADEMGATANLEWDRIFGPSGLFHYTVECCMLLLEMQARRNLISKLITLKYLFQSPYNRELLQFVKNKLIGQITSLI